MNGFNLIESLFKKGLLRELDIFITSNKNKEEVLYDGLALEGYIKGKPENFEKYIKILHEMCMKKER